MGQHQHHAQRVYWRRNIKLIAVLLVIWLSFAIILPFLAIDQLNNIEFAGFKLGFWIAQQGSIIMFIGLIFIYALLADKLDRAYYREVVQNLVMILNRIRNLSHQELPHELGYILGTQ